MFRFLTKCPKTLIPKSYHNHLKSSSNSTILSSNFGTNVTTLSIENQNTSTITELLISCGFKPSPKPISVLTFLKSFGISDTQIKTVIIKSPFLLSFDVSRNLKPKIEFFRSIGLSELDVAKIVISYLRIFLTSLQNTLIPAFNLVKKYYGGQEIAVDRVKRWPPLIQCGVCECLPQNVETLHDLGVPGIRVTKLITGLSCYSIFAKTKPQYLKKVVSTVKNMGFDPCSSSFQHAIQAMAGQTESGWVKKVKVYKSLGLSDSEINEMFKKQPISLWMSEKKIMAAAKFYFEKFNWKPSHLLKNPNALMYSLEKRVVPRCSVLQVLAVRNKVKNVNIITLLVKTENEFLERYVNNYKDEIPEVLDAYQGKIKFNDFTFYLE